MEEKFSSGKFDFNEFKEEINKIKDAAKEAKSEENKEPKENKKTSMGQQIIGIIILIAVVVGTLAIIISNLDTILLPENSIKILVSDQNGEIIEGLTVTLQGENGAYLESFTSQQNITILKATPGDYIISFENIPEGYTCSTLSDNFTLNDGEKLKVKYECIKE